MTAADGTVRTVADDGAVVCLELVAERTRVEQLSAALVSNRRIGIAVGLVMAQHGCSDTESFATLRRVSMDSNRRLADVAEDVIGRRRLAASPGPAGR